MIAVEKLPIPLIYLLFLLVACFLALPDLVLAQPMGPNVPSPTETPVSTSAGDRLSGILFLLLGVLIAERPRWRMIEFLRFCRKLHPYLSVRVHFW